jgi:hypothetical protein
MPGYILIYLCTLGFFCFVVVLGFKLRDLCSLGRRFTTWATPIARERRTDDFTDIPLKFIWKLLLESRSEVASVRNFNFFDTPLLRVRVMSPCHDTGLLWALQSGGSDAVWYPSLSCESLWKNLSLIPWNLSSLSCHVRSQTLLRPPC